MTTEHLWMLTMVVMFGLFLRGLRLEAKRSLQAIARTEDDSEWRDQMQVALVQHEARRRLHAMREEQTRRETARRAKAEREALRAAQLRRARWEYEAPHADGEADLSGEAFGDHGFAAIADIIDEDSLYAPLRDFGDRLNNRMAQEIEEIEESQDELFVRRGARAVQAV
jgi:uncharacterized ferredoxin-like protein